MVQWLWHGGKVGRREIVSVPFVEIAYVHNTIRVKVAGTPRRCIGELAAIPDVEIGHIDHTVQITITRKVWIAAGVVDSACLCEPHRQVVSINVFISIQIED